MKQHLHRILSLGIAAAATTLALTGNAWSQAFPSKPIRWVVVAPAGSSLDVIARAMQDKLRDTLGQPVVIDNRVGAGGTLGTNEVAKSAPDGTTFLVNDTTYAMLPSLFAKLPWDHANDLVPVTTLAPPFRMVAPV